MKTLSKVICMLWVTVFLAVPSVTASMGGDTEVKQILAAARIYVESVFADGRAKKSKFRFVREVKEYALVNMTPKTKYESQFEGASIILKKHNGNWVGQVMGTCLIDWEKKMPELFR
jgi:hypothetical protein